MKGRVSRRAAPLAKVFWGQRWSAKVWAQNGLIKKKMGQEAVWAKSGHKNQKTWEKQKSKENPSPLHPKQKITKNMKEKISPPPSLTKKNDKCSMKENQIKMLLKNKSKKRRKTLCCSCLVFWAMDLAAPDPSIVLCCVVVWCGVLVRCVFKIFVGASKIWALPPLSLRRIPLLKAGTLNCARWGGPTLRSWMASRIPSRVWCLAFTHHMRWCMFWHTGNPRIEPLRMMCWRRCRWSYKKNASRCTARVPIAWWPIAAAWHPQRTPQHSTRNWMRCERHRLTGNVGMSTAYWFSILKIFRIIHTINFILQFLNLTGKVPE